MNNKSNHSSILEIRLISKMNVCSYCSHAFSITSAYILHVLTNSRLVGPFTSMNIFNRGRIITLLRKHPSSHFRPSLLMLCGLKIPPLKICWICFIGACVGCTKEFLEIHRKNAEVAAASSHMAASWLPHANMVALLCHSLKVALWATINGGKKVTMRHQPSSCSPCGCHLTTEKSA